MFPTRGQQPGVRTTFVRDEQRVRSRFDNWENTISERGFGEPSQGPVIPLGSKIQHHRISAKDQSKLHQFGMKVLVADVEAPRSRKCWTRRKPMLGDSMQKEVIMPKNGENFIFPIADGTANLSGRNQVFRKATQVRDYPARGEEHRDDLRGESDGSQRLDTITADSDARNDFWTTAGNYIYRHHVEPRVKLYVPKEESDFVRRTKTTLDVLLECRKDDDWNADGDRDRSLGPVSHSSQH